MTKIIVNYSEDFRELTAIREVYSILRTNNLNPEEVIVHYDVSKGEGAAIYIFKERDILPDKSKLKNMLRGISYREITVQK